MNADDVGLTKCTSIKMLVVFKKLTKQKFKSSNLLNIILNVDKQPTVDWVKISLSLSNFGSAGVENKIFLNQFWH